MATNDYNSLFKQRIQDIRQNRTNQSNSQDIGLPPSIQTAQQSVNSSGIGGGFDEQLENINQQSQQIQQNFTDLANEIRAGYNENKIDVEATLAPLRKNVQKSIDDMTTAYNTQIAQQSEQIDAMEAGGQLGTNAYRAFQVRSKTNRDIMGQALGQISQFSTDAYSQLTNFSISAQAQNQQLFSNTMSTLGSIAQSQAQSMLGFSSLYTQTLAEQSNQLINILGIQADIYKANLSMSNNIMAQIMAQIIPSLVKSAQAKDRTLRNFPKNLANAMNEFMLLSGGLF